MQILVADVGGTKTRSAWYVDGRLEQTSYHSAPTHRYRPQRELVQTLYAAMRQTAHGRVPDGVSIAVPGTVDDEKAKILSCGIARNLNNCPLKALVEEEFRDWGTDCHLENDGNVFALAEYYAHESVSPGFVGIILGTGFGSGHVIRGELYTGMNGSAGEYGRLPHDLEEGNIDDVSSGQWLERVYGVKGEVVFRRAHEENNNEAQHAFTRFGRNLAHSLTKPIYAYGPQEIVIGGIGKDSFYLYAPALRKELNAIRGIEEKPEEVLQLSQSMTAITPFPIDIPEHFEKPSTWFELPTIRKAILDHPNLIGAGIAYEQARGAFRRKMRQPFLQA